MTIPTQFNVTNTIKAPVANPDNTLDLAHAIESKDVAFISGASSYNTLASASIDTPVATSAVSIPVIDTPAVSVAQAVQDIVNPSLYTSASAPTLDTPVVSTAQSVPVLATASAYTSKGATSNTPPYPLNHARILYNNLLQSATVTSNASGSNPQLSLVPNTFQRWAFTSASTQEIIFTLPANITMDTFCFGGHNLFFGNAGTRFRFSYSDDLVSSFFILNNYREPLDNSAVMIHASNAVSVRRLKLEIEASPSREKYIAYISAGIAMQMQRPFFNGHNPYPDSDVTEYYSSRSESGEIIGRQIRRKGFETQAEVTNLTDTWYRNYFADFKEKAKTQPFFMAWNLLEYPTDVAFAETTGDIKAAMQNGSIVRRNVSFTYRGV